MEDDADLKPHSTHATIKWLEDNYCLEEGVCLPRSLIYEHYTDHCQRERSQPVNAASFGKIIRQQFTSLTTRRLGTRGQSKYHYFGLGIKSSSRYYTKDYTDKLEHGVGKKTPDKKQPPAQDKPSAVLPPFPNVFTLVIADSIPVDKLKTFVVMYRAHCQRIVDSVVRANFAEVENFLLHFWKGMPTHLLPVLASDVVVDLVAHCDAVLYHVINNVLISSPLQSVPESLVNDIRMFSEQLRQWLEAALVGLPESLQEAKYKIAEGFANSLKRQTALTHLAEVTRNTLHANNMFDQLRTDWSSLDLFTVYTQLLYTIQPLDVPQCYLQMIPSLLHEFTTLLDRCSDLDHLLAWTKDVIDRTVNKVSADDVCSLKKASQVFLLTWKNFTSKIIRELTLASAPSFGCFHLLHMLVDDYIVHLLETALERQEELAYTRRLDERRKSDLSLLDSDDRDHHLLSDQHHSPASIFSSPESSVLAHGSPGEPTVVGPEAELAVGPGSDVLSYDEHFSLPSLRNAASDPSLHHPVTTTSIAQSTLTESSELPYSGPLSRAQPLHSSFSHLPFAAVISQPSTEYTPTPPLPPSLSGQIPSLTSGLHQPHHHHHQQQQQQQPQQYPGYQPSSSATIPLSRPSGGGYNVMSHSYRSSQPALSLTAPPTSIIPHALPLSTASTAPYSSFPPDPSSLTAGGLVSHNRGLPHVAAMPNFPSFSMPVAHTAPASTYSLSSSSSSSSSSSTNLATPSNLSLFPQGVYPYTPFMSISTLPQIPGQMNQPFVGGLPGQTGASYPYLSPSLYASTTHESVTTGVTLGDRNKLKQ